MTIDEVLKHYDNEIKAAANIGVSLQTIMNWKANKKIPRMAQLAIQTLTKNKLKADET